MESWLQKPGRIDGWLLRYSLINQTKGLLAGILSYDLDVGDMVLVYIAFFSQRRRWDIWLELRYCGHSFCIKTVSFVCDLHLINFLVVKIAFGYFYMHSDILHVALVELADTLLRVLFIIWWFSFFFLLGGRWGRGWFVGAEVVGWLHETLWRLELDIVNKNLQCSVGEYF